MADKMKLPGDTLLFIDDHPIYCEGMALALSRDSPNLRVLTVRSGDEALDLLAHATIDLVLCDYRLTDEDGVAVLQRIAAGYPTVALGILCAEPTPALAGRAKAAGAVACLSKERDVVGMLDALECLFNGEQVFDIEPPAQGQYGISDHRVRIIRLASEGHSNKEIARQLGITERTVKDHWTVILERLNATNRMQAIRFAHSKGIIDLSV